MAVKNIDQCALPAPEWVAPRTKKHEPTSAYDSSLAAKVGVIVFLILFGALHFVGAAKIYSRNGLSDQTHTLAAD